MSLSVYIDFRILPWTQVYVQEPYHKCCVALKFFTPKQNMYERQIK